MPRLRTQLTGWESSRFCHSHILRYLTVRSPLSASHGISSLALQGQGPVETSETLRRWVKWFPHWSMLFYATRLNITSRNFFFKEDTTIHLICFRFVTLSTILSGKYILHISIQRSLSNSQQPGPNTTFNSWIHICYGQRHSWWAQTVMWHLNILIKNACLEGKQRGASGAPARED